MDEKQFSIAQLMSNLCFNLQYQTELPEELRTRAKALVHQWDVATSPVPEVKKS